MLAPTDGRSPPSPHSALIFQVLTDSSAGWELLAGQLAVFLLAYTVARWLKSACLEPEGPPGSRVVMVSSRSASLRLSVAPTLFPLFVIIGVH